jgi:plasmid maintenance system antidote protein VapI
MEGFFVVSKNSLIPNSDLLRVLVESSGLTHSQIAMKAQCERSTVTRIVRGERRVDPELAARIAKSLGVRRELAFVKPAAMEESRAQQSSATRPGTRSRRSSADPDHRGDLCAP